MQISSIIWDYRSFDAWYKYQRKEVKKIYIALPETRELDSDQIDGGSRNPCSKLNLDNSRTFIVSDFCRICTRLDFHHHSVDPASSVSSEIVH